MSTNGVVSGASHTPLVERLRGGQDNAAYPSRAYMLEAADTITELLEALEAIADGAWQPIELAKRAIAKARGEA